MENKVIIKCIQGQEAIVGEKKNGCIQNPIILLWVEEKTAIFRQ